MSSEPSWPRSTSLWHRRASRSTPTISAPPSTSSSAAAVNKPERQETAFSTEKKSLSRLVGGVQVGSLRRIVAMAAVIGLLPTFLVGRQALAEWDSDPLNTQLVLRHHYLCGLNDLPEEGIQGDVSKADQDSRRAEKGYNCGLALVGHATLDHGGRPATGNANMAWAGNCAYVAGPGGGIAPQMYTPPPPANGVAVVDVSNSAHPKHVATLHGPDNPGANAVSETINAVTTASGRSTLVVGQYGKDTVVNPPGKQMDV